jgi:cell division protein FtsB
MRNVRFGAAARIGLGVILLVALLFVGVFPTRTYMRQRETIAGTEKQLTVLRSANGKLREEVKRLEDTEAVERIAREQYNLAKPGEEVFILIPEQEPASAEDAAAETADLLREIWGAG